MKRGFTLIEMLVVIGIIAILIVATTGGYSAMTKAAERAREKELVQQVALALSAMYMDNAGVWPKRLALVGESGGEFDPDRSYVFVSGAKKYLTLSNSGGKLTGYDRFGILTPAGVNILKKRGSNATESDVSGHRLWFAVDADGDGVIEGSAAAPYVRATAIVWCAGKDGKRVQSWTAGQTRK